MSAETKVQFGADWRAHLKVHPAADLFPLMSESELRELGEDIKKHGLSNPVTLWRDDDDGGKLYLLDGRNRLDAMAEVGIQFFSTTKDIRTPNGQTLSKTLPDPPGAYALETDPYAFVVSANITRRHLTAEQKRDLIANVLKATPEKSNRQIASIAKADDKTIAKVRTELEATAEIPQLTKTTGADGKARKQRKKPKAAKMTTLKGQAVKTADLGPAAQEQLKALEAGTKPEPEADTDTSAEARKAFYAENAVTVTVVPNPKQDPVQVRVITEPAPASAPTDNDLTEDALARSQRGYDEIGMTMIQWLPRMMTVHKTKLLDFLVNHPEMANVKVPKRREKVAA
jgi:hypothetical protein